MVHYAFFRSRDAPEEQLQPFHKYFNYIFKIRKENAT